MHRAYNLSELTYTIGHRVQHGSLQIGVYGCLRQATAECMPEHDMCNAS